MVINKVLFLFLRSTLSHLAVAAALHGHSLTELLDWSTSLTASTASQHISKDQHHSTYALGQQSAIIKYHSSGGRTAKSKDLTNPTQGRTLFLTGWQLSSCNVLKWHLAWLFSYALGRHGDTLPPTFHSHRHFLSCVNIMILTSSFSYWDVTFGGNWWKRTGILLLFSYLHTFIS